MSAYTKPVVIGQDNQAWLLERIPLMPGSSEGFSENWLQKVLFQHPASLPLKEIDPAMGQLIPVCMELETGAGPADILYVTASGQIVLVETKLWRNPEARRQVVGQVLDYAKQLTTWSYETLDEKSALAAKSTRGHLLRCVKSLDPTADEADFVDGISRNLRSGEFLLLIVGDGIRTGAESLVGFLEKFGHLKFGLGLVEVAAYNLPSGGFLVQPRVLARTELLQRTLLIGHQGPVQFQEAAAAEDEAVSESLQTQRDWYTRFWSDFLTVLRRQDPGLGAGEPAKASNQFFPMPPYGGRAWVSAYVALAGGYAGVYLTFSKSFAQATELADQFTSDSIAIEEELGVPLAISRTGDKVYLGVPRIPFNDLDGADRALVRDQLVEMTRRMIATFKPRLEALTAAHANQ